MTQPTSAHTPAPGPSLGEEVANSITHGAGFLASLVALPVLAVSAAGRGDPLQMFGNVTFGAALVLLYGASTLYHAIPPCTAKRVLRTLDHSAIYVLIAGTYTPFAVGSLRGPWGWWLFGVIWSLAILGIVAKATVGHRFPRLSTVVYLLMGWLIVVAIRPLLASVPLAGLAWLLAGGLAYTGGVLFYVRDRIRYNHMVWHLFVAAGSVCHFIAVLLYSGAGPDSG